MNVIEQLISMVKYITKKEAIFFWNSNYCSTHFSIHAYVQSSTMNVFWLANYTQVHSSYMSNDVQEPYC